MTTSSFFSSVEKGEEKGEGDAIGVLAKADGGARVSGEGLATTQIPTRQD